MLLTILAVALVLRGWGLSYGLPNVYNPDEVAILSRSLSLAEKGLNPENFVYPSLFFYMLAGVIGVWYAGLRTVGQIGSIGEFQQAFWADPSAVYLVGRSVSVAAGVATVALTYALARRIADRHVARAAAALMAVAYFPVRDAHMIKHDVLATLGFLLCVLASYRAREQGARSAFVLAAVTAGATFALHYYGIAAMAPVIVALLLHHVATGQPRAAITTLAIVGVTFALAFAVLSPYVLIDWTRALSDISANRAIIVDRARDQFGVLGSGWEQIRLMYTQGAGYAMAAAAAAGVVALLWSRGRESLLFLSFPAAFLLLLSQTWPYGRLQNALYPFVAITAAFALREAARRMSRPALALGVLTALAAVQPLWQDVLLATHMTKDDTRTMARRWIEQHVPDGAMVAVQPYSVPLEPGQAWLTESFVARTPGERPGARIRGLAAREPYPMPAYRLVFIGDSDTDRERRFISPSAILSGAGTQALRDAGIAYVVLRFDRVGETSALGDHIASGAALIHRVSPFSGEPPAGFRAFLADHDVRPTWATRLPGPIIEVWQVSPHAPPAP